MRTDYDFLRIIKNLFNFVIIKFKPLTIQVEAIMIDNVWEKIKKNVLSKKVFKWYIVTPANYNSLKAYFNIKQSKREISKIMAERYRWMLEHGQRLELNIHLSIIEDMSLEEQEKIFKEAISWIKKELKIKVKEVIPACWAYNKSTMELCKKLELKLIKFSDYNSTHDYHWILKKNKN